MDAGFGRVLAGEDRCLTVSCMGWAARVLVAVAMVGVAAIGWACAEEPVTDNAANVFHDLARTMDPIPVYGLSELPEGASLADEWWPILEYETGGAYSGSDVANPHVTDAGQADCEAQVLLTLEAGTVAVLENYRGDLGDVTGLEVGRVGEQTATLYEVNGGLLVQWSDAGCWYGVFSRVLSEEEIMALALSMRVVSPAVSG